MIRRHITDRPSYLKAQKEYDELHDLLGGLTSKLSNVSKHVDKEFLASYRVHMLSIQCEIKSLREDVEKGVQALKSDGNVAKLEMEVNWFVEECTRLRLHYTTMENDRLQMQARFKAMLEQKKYMNEQLKAILKRNRVLEAEIEHAVTFNQKLKMEENADNEQIRAEEVDEHTGQHHQEAAPVAAVVDEDDQQLTENRLYHEQLRRQAQHVPLSTAKFLPDPRSLRGSRSGGSARLGGSSRGSSRSRSRSHSRSRSRSRSRSPSSPHRTGSFNPTTVGSARFAMQEALNTFGVERFEEQDFDTFGVADDDEQFDQGQRRAHTLPPLPSGPSQQPVTQPRSLRLTGPLQAQSQKEPSTKQPASSNNNGANSNTGGIPKVQPQPSATLRAQKKRRQQREQQAKQELLDFLKHKSPAEASLERVIADIFDEVRQRKVHAAKRGSIKRFDVSFMGNDALPGDEPGISRKRSEVPATGRSTGGSNNNSSSNTGRAGTPVLPDAALGRRLSAAATGVQQPDSDGQQQQQQQIGRGPAALGLSEVDLLGQPLIHVTGGISGLGANQLSDNDRFSCIVKYLLNFDRFQEVVEKLQEHYQY